MRTAVALLAVAAFAVLALWHVWMAFNPSGAESAAVPSAAGKPLFAPSRAATLLVAALLLCFGALIAATAGVVQVLVPRAVLNGLSYALALGLLARAVGDFRYVGFFKRLRGSRFARMDTRVYSPVCLLLSIAVAFVTYADAA